MKKIAVLSLTLVLLSVAASAQLRPGNRNHKVRTQRGVNSGQFTRPEKMELNRDGVVGPIERKRLRHARCEGRRDAVRFKHNGRRRVI
jgi:hypothetical protein